MSQIQTINRFLIIIIDVPYMLLIETISDSFCFAHQHAMPIKSIVDETDFLYISQKFNKHYHFSLNKHLELFIIVII